MEEVCPYRKHKLEGSHCPLGTIESGSLHGGTDVTEAFSLFFLILQIKFCTGVNCSRGEVTIFVVAKKYIKRCMIVEGRE